jgi:glutamine synthetase adenylyltransferase
MIPINTTLVDFLRPDGSADTFEDQGEPTAIATDVRAHLSKGRVGSEQLGAGSQSRLNLILVCDPVDDVRHTDVVRDQTDGAVYNVGSIRHVTGVGLDHLEVALELIEGQV